MDDAALPPVRGALLRFELVEGRYPEAESVATALTDWADVLRASADVIAPGSTVRVEIAAVEAGSQIYDFLVRKVEPFFADLREGRGALPATSQAMVTLGGLIVGTVGSVGLTAAITPEPRLPEDQMATFRSLEAAMQESVELQRSQAKLYGTLQNEPAFGAIEVLDANRQRIYRIPRAEFATRSGLWSSNEVELESAQQKRTDTWDLVVIKPVLVPQERMWRVAKDGFEFSALMQDKDVLQAIHEKTLPMRIEEGAMMKVEIEYRETFNGSVWTRDTRSYKIKRVLSPDLSGSIKSRFAPDAP